MWNVRKAGMSVVAAALAVGSIQAVAAVQAAGVVPMKAMLVVQNHVSDDFRKPLSNIGDRLGAALSGDVLSIIDPNDSIGVNLNRSPWGEDLPASSATRLAENLGAKALVTASIGEISVTGIGSPAIAQFVKMTMTLSAKRVSSGASIAAVTVSEKSPKMTPKAFEQNADSVYSDLVGKLVENASAQFLAKVASAVRQEDEPEEITIFFGCNVIGADVQIDGLSLGTCPGPFKVTPGVHNVRVSYPPYYNDFCQQAKLTQNCQTFAVVLQLNQDGERQRLGTLDYERKSAELEMWKREKALDIDARGIDVERKRRELDFEFEKKRKDLESEFAERSELFKKQLALADAMLGRYELSGETDDYVRKTIADGTSIYWQNSYGRIAITDGTATNIEFATPVTKTEDITAPSKSGEIANDLRELLMKGPGQ